MRTRSVIPKVNSALALLVLLSLGAVQARLLKQATHQGASTTPYTENMRSVTPTSYKTGSATTKPPGGVSIDSSTSMAGTQQLQTLRSVTPSSYTPMTQPKASGIATVDQATVAPVHPANSEAQPATTAANMQTATASGATGMRMETLADAGSAMSMRQVP